MDRFLIRQDVIVDDRQQQRAPDSTQHRRNVAKHDAVESIPRKRARTGGLSELRRPKTSTKTSSGLLREAKASTSTFLRDSARGVEANVEQPVNFRTSKGQDSTRISRTPRYGRDVAKAVPGMTVRRVSAQFSQDVGQAIPDSAKKSKKDVHAAAGVDSPSPAGVRTFDRQMQRGARSSSMTSFFPPMMSAGTSKERQSATRSRSPSEAAKDRSAFREVSHNSPSRNFSETSKREGKEIEEDEVEDDEHQGDTETSEAARGTGSEKIPESVDNSGLTGSQFGPSDTATSSRGKAERREERGRMMPEGTSPAGENNGTLESGTTSRGDTPGDEPPKLLKPPRRLGGMASLFLTQRRCTGGKSIGNYGGEDAFRRRVMSSVFGGDVTTNALKMGRVAGSGTGVGVVCGHPEGRQGSLRAGVTCLEFDSMGALLAAGEMDCVSVYDFDEFLPQYAPFEEEKEEEEEEEEEEAVRRRLAIGDWRSQMEMEMEIMFGSLAAPAIPKVQPMGSGDPTMFLQPTHCIQTRRAVSCVRWNPTNENQLAISFLNYDEIEVFDLEGVLPNREAIPVVTLAPGSGPIRRAGSNDYQPYSRGFRRNRGHLGSTVGVPGVNGGVRGLGHLAFQFVMRGTPHGTPHSRAIHVVAGGREGTFRAWRIGTSSMGKITPYLQVLPSSNPRSGAFTGWLKPCANITALCCLTPDVALVATDSGTLATFSLEPPAVKAFGSGKSAQRLAQWFLGDPKVWGGTIFPGLGSEGPDALRICFVHPSHEHASWIVLCGLGSGQCLLFDTRAGRVLGITPKVSPGRMFCRTGAAASWGASILSCATALEGGQELRILATSAVASLDGRRRGGRESTLRPGPGWELGGAGGGGFRAEGSSGYHLCLPFSVERATPGQNGVLLSGDARSYLCPRTEERLLRSNMVTSAVCIGSHKYRVEAMGRGGTSLVLDRLYQGPRVREGRVVCGTSVSAHDEAGADGEDRESNQGDREQQTCSAGPASSQRRRNLPEATLGTSAASSRTPRDSQRQSEGGGPDGGDGDKRPPSHEAEGSADPSSGNPNVDGGGWDGWRSDRVRVFAKLKAVFDLDPAPMSSPHLRFKYPWENLSVSASKTEETDELEVAIDEGRASGMAEEDDRCGSWASLPVVARAPLNLRATTLTCHPDMNFILVGLEDGTIAAVLPGRNGNVDTSSEQ